MLDSSVVVAKSLLFLRRSGAAGSRRRLRASAR